MGGLSLGLRIALGLFGLAALASVAFLVKDRFHQKGLADAAAHCAAAASSAVKPLADCLPAIRERLESERRFAACERALVPSLRPETRFAASQACGSGVKRLVAVMDGAIAERDNLQQLLAQQEATALRAIERAEVRSSKLTERDAHARQAIASAPRDAGGGIVCDAGCLRQLGN